MIFWVESRLPPGVLSSMTTAAAPLLAPWATPSAMYPAMTLSTVPSAVRTSTWGGEVSAADTAVTTNRPSSASGQGQPATESARTTGHRTCQRVWHRGAVGGACGTARPPAHPARTSKASLLHVSIASRTAATSSVEANAPASFSVSRMDTDRPAASAV